MAITDALDAQKIVQRIAIELRVPSRFWDRTDVHELRNVVQSQQRQKMIGGMGRVPDGKEGVRIGH